MPKALLPAALVDHERGEAVPDRRLERHRVPEHIGEGLDVEPDAEHRRGTQQRTIRRGQAVDLQCEERLERVGEVLDGSRRPVSLEQLAQEQRAATGALHQQAAFVREQRGSVRRRREQRGRVLQAQ